MAGAFGKQELILEHAGEILVDRNGLWTGSCRFSLPKERFDLLPAVSAPHPYAAFLAVEKLRLIFGAGLWRVVADYAGMDAAYDISESQYELSPGTGNEPIETHPDFITFAGTPSSPNGINRPLFRDPVTGEISTDDANAEFDRFALDSPMAGVSSYIAQNNTVYSRSWTQRSQPSEGGISIVQNPPGPAPNYGGDYNWLEMPVAYARRAGVYSCTQRWLCSGPKGWNNDLY
jgi:hypothetical protein